MQKKYPNWFSRESPRMRRLARLYAETQRDDLLPHDLQSARYRLAEYIARNENGIYFNDSLWAGLQRYALTADNDGRFTREEHATAVQQERQLKDEQEERWRAYLILHDVVRDSGESTLRRKAALLALDDLTRISDRFGREGEIRAAIRDLRQVLHR
jgi:hypothetical protein